MSATVIDLGAAFHARRLAEQRGERKGCCPNASRALGRQAFDDVRHGKKQPPRQLTDQPEPPNAA